MTDSNLHLLAIVIFLTLLLITIAVGTIYTAKLKASEELWKFALEGSGDGVWDWDIVKDIAHLSSRYKEIFGLNDDDISTSSVQDWNNRIHPDDIASMNEAVNNYLTGVSKKYVHEHRIVCKDRSIKWVLSRGMIVKRDKNGKPLRMVGTHTDITERKSLENKLKTLAYFDSLSNIPNRILFIDRLNIALAYAKRERKLLAVMFIDLDLFKKINDLHGHEIGDIALKMVSSQLVASIRESDTVARLGGDEFVILLPLINNEEDIISVATKILEAVAKPMKIGKLNLYVTCSIGAAIYPQHGIDEKQLLMNADRAMYQAKQSGKNQVKIFAESMKE
jgi:diguanylate cyclase (GGDEF)-like protein/PAS domain S-box-containing protein